MTYLNFDKSQLVNLEYSLKRELIRTNRAGSFACTTIIGSNTRKYHGLLICPFPDIDGGRHVLLSSIDETVVQHEKEFNLALHKYAGDNYEPKGHKYIRDFTTNPIPKILYNVGGVILSKEMVFLENEPRILIKYTLLEANSETRMKFKPFLAFRNIHRLSKANMDVNTKVGDAKNGISSKLYHGYPDLYLQFSKKGEFTPAPDWYYNIEYYEEQKRGYEYKEDLFVPGYFELPIKKGESVIFSAGLTEVTPSTLNAKFQKETEKRIPRDTFENCLSNTIEQFFINQGKKTFIISGYPWLPIRSRDAFIALPGLVLPDLNAQLFHTVMQSFISNMEGAFFPEVIDDVTPKNFPVDVPLWYIWSIQQLGLFIPNQPIWKLYGKTVKKIVQGFLKEKEQFYIDTNGLIYETKAEYYNSWMNSALNNQPLIERFGYKIETNALWYNALCFAISFADKNEDEKWIQPVKTLKSMVEKSFSEVFWDSDKGYFADFVTRDEKNMQIRPNQLFAASLPYAPISKEQIIAAMECMKNQLLTDYGIRTLSPTDEYYIPKYKGNHEERETAAFNGSVWPWLFTHYFEALSKINLPVAQTAAKKFIEHMEPEIQTNAICAISELYHADPPHEAKGALSFAMNTGEIIRLKHLIDAYV